MIGETLRIIRKANDMKITTASEISNISRSYITEIEQNKKIPSKAILEKLCICYNIPLEQLEKLNNCIEDKNLNFQQALLLVLEYYDSKDKNPANKKSAKSYLKSQTKK